LRKSKRRLPGDVHQPAIITFDSLNLTRAPTIRALREYLRAEARSKQGLEINKTLIEGMKAREIPLQPNYSDCGLYLLAYVEKFVQDPDNFIRKLLKDEMKEKADWPRLRPGLLRARLRNFLDDLYDEQMQLSPQEASEQALMVDRQPITYLLGTLEHDAEGKDDEVEAQKSPLLSAIQAPVKSDDGRVEKATPSREPSESPKNSRDCALEPEHTNAEEAMTHGTEDKPSEIRQTPELDKHALDQADEVVEVPDSQDQNHLPVPPPSPPKVLIKYRATARREPQQQEDSKHRANNDACSSKNQPEEIPETDTECPPKSRVEVQIIGSPSSPNTRGAAKRSPKSSKNKSKHAAE
jgi:hypothetical protein